MSLCGSPPSSICYIQLTLTWIRISCMKSLHLYQWTTWNTSKDCFICRISSIRYKAYRERRTILYLEILQIRCLRLDILKYYKIYHGVDAINRSDHFKYSNSTYFSTRSASRSLIDRSAAQPNCYTISSATSIFATLFFFCPKRSISIRFQACLIDLSQYLKGDFYWTFFYNFRVYNVRCHCFSLMSWF